jgi:hypothetical protein
MADRHPLLLGTSVALLLMIMSFAWALPLDRSFAGKRLQLGRAVHPAELAFLSIEADPARVTWIGAGRPPKQLLTARLVYLGKADGILVLYQPPNWGSCEVDSCRGATWKVHESDVVLRLEVNPPDRDAPRAATSATTTIGDKGVHVRTPHEQWESSRSWQPWSAWLGCLGLPANGGVSSCLTLDPTGHTTPWFSEYRR